MIGRSFTSFPLHDFSDVPSNRLSRWQQLTKMLTNTWKHWSDDYLQKRQKWSTDHPNLMIGDVVLIKGDLFPPLQWNLGKIVKLFPGTDGNVTVVSVKSSRGEFRRSIHKLAKLPIADDVSL